MFVYVSFAYVKHIKTSWSQNGVVLIPEPQGSESAAATQIFCCRVKRMSEDVCMYVFMAVQGFKFRASYLLVRGSGAMPQPKWGCVLIKLCLQTSLALKAGRGLYMACRLHFANACFTASQTWAFSPL
jgi:hypothetical protein